MPIELAQWELTELQDMSRHDGDHRGATLRDTAFLAGLLHRVLATSAGVVVKKDKPAGRGSRTKSPESDPPPEIGWVTKADYVQKGFAHCPYCESGELSESGVSTGEGAGNRVHVQVTCLVCHYKWTDIYTLTGVEAEDEGA